jgi:hypothetical protein
MPTIIDFKEFIDLPMWRPEAPPLAVSAAGASFAWDHRNSINGSPYLFWLRAATALDAYDCAVGEWIALPSPALTTMAAGATAVMHPTQGPRGTIAGGASTTQIALSTALPAAVGVNQLANRGDAAGFRIRIIGNSAGGSGKIETRSIVANTGGLTPTLLLDSALTFTPQAGDTYELISGRVFLLGSGVAGANSWKAYDIATNSYLSLAFTGLPTVSNDSNACALSESHVPYDRDPGEGFVTGAAVYDGGAKQCIQGTAATATTITGSGMDVGGEPLLADEYRNFQVRIVEDTTSPQAVGQRRRISSHTGGATGVFTIYSAWTTNPSATAKFVIENDDDKILLRTSANTPVYTYNIAGNTWDTTTFAAAPVCGAGVTWDQGFGYKRDALGGARHSHIHCIRGGASSAIDVLDIAGGATGVWSNDIAYGKKGQTFTTGTSGAYDPATKEGRIMHICINGTQRMARYDLKNRIMDADTYLRYPPSTAVTGQKMANVLFIDGATKQNIQYNMVSSLAALFSCLTQ